ncbi:MAG: hypothetical protein WC749_09865 [Dehalococcoidia bacterium]
MPSLIQFPVLLARTGNEQPPEGEDTYYLIGKNGIFLHKRTGIVEAVVPVDKIPQLMDVETWGDLDVPPIPLALFAQAWHFFRRVWKQMHTEAAILLFYDASVRAWSLEVPDQQVKDAGVHYDDKMQKPGCVKAGTIHSHCDFGASHSPGDYHDEYHFDGLHITVGHVDQFSPTISVSVVINGLRFMKSLEDYLAGVSMREYEIEVTPPPVQVHSHSTNVRRQTGHVEARKGSPSRRIASHGVIAFFRSAFSLDVNPPESPVVVEPLNPAPPPPAPKIMRKVRGMHIDFPPGMDVEKYPFPDEWMDRVHRYISPPAKVVVYQGQGQHWSAPTHSLKATPSVGSGGYNTVPHSGVPSHVIDPFEENWEAFFKKEDAAPLRTVLPSTDEPEYFDPEPTSEEEPSTTTVPEDTEKA